MTVHNAAGIRILEQMGFTRAVLARELEIPSRVVWGFTPGDVADNGVITVRDTNAHAWVELWIEPYGWFPFDPTPRAEQTGFDPQPGDRVPPEIQGHSGYQLSVGFGDAVSALIARLPG